MFKMIEIALLKVLKRKKLISEKEYFKSIELLEKEMKKNTV